MRLRIQKPARPDALTTLAQLCEAVDRGIPPARTAFLIAGLVAAALNVGNTADFLFATGLAFHLAICFENWWLATMRR